MMDWIEKHIQTLCHPSALTEAQARMLFLRVLRVELDERVRANRTYRLAYLYALNLLTRMFPYTQFSVEEGEPLLILPWGTGTPLAAPGQPEQTLVFGRSGTKTASGLLTANCHDWSVYIDSPVEVDPAEPWNPVLALVTACYAAARAAQALLGNTIDQESWRPFSILDFAQGRVKFDWSATLALGEAHLAGVGAIGSAFLYALGAHGTAEGTLVLADHDKVDIGNLGRYTLFDLNDVGTYKTLAAKERLRKFELRVKVDPIEKRFEQHFRDAHAENNSFRVAKLISAPDRRATRRTLQQLLPRALWDASTGPNQVVVHSNQFDPAYACVECIYPETPDEQAHARHVAQTLNVELGRLLSGELIGEVDAARIRERYPHLQLDALVGKDFYSIFGLLCSAGELRTENGVVLAPFSFVSGLAGVLLYFELVKSHFPEVFAPFQQHNYFQVNPMRMPNPEFRELRPSRKECMCQKEVVRRVFQRVWTAQNDA